MVVVAVSEKLVMVGDITLVEQLVAIGKMVMMMVEFCLQGRR